MVSVFAPIHLSYHPKCLGTGDSCVWQAGDTLFNYLKHSTFEEGEVVVTICLISVRRGGLILSTGDG